MYEHLGESKILLSECVENVDFGFLQTLQCLSIRGYHPTKICFSDRGLPQSIKYGKCEIRNWSLCNNKYEWIHCENEYRTYSCDFYTNDEDTFLKTGSNHFKVYFEAFVDSYDSWMISKFEMIAEDFSMFRIIKSNHLLGKSEISREIKKGNFRADIYLDRMYNNVLQIKNALPMIMLYKNEENVENFFMEGFNIIEDNYPKEKISKYGDVVVCVSNNMRDIIGHILLKKGEKFALSIMQKNKKSILEIWCALPKSKAFVAVSTLGKLMDMSKYHDFILWNINLLMSCMNGSHPIGLSLSASNEEIGNYFEENLIIP